MALKFFRQRDIDEMDAGNIPEEFVNYFESLDYDRKVALLGSRTDLAAALGFTMPENEPSIREERNHFSQEPTIQEKSDEQKTQNLIKDQSNNSRIDNGNEPQIDIFSQIRKNAYEGINLDDFVKDDMGSIEALAIPDDEKKCMLHHKPFIKRQIRYHRQNMPIYSMVFRICKQCNRLFIEESSMENIHQALTKRNVPHTFFPLSLTNQYLRSLIPPHEFLEGERLYVPDTWIEEHPICPIHESELYEVKCFKRYKGREITFTGYFCEQCDKILIRRSAALNLEDECGRVGITPIEYEALRKKAPEKKPLPPPQIQSDYIIENGKRTPFRHRVNNACYILTESDTVIVSDSIYCSLEGHDCNEVVAQIWVESKRENRKAYLIKLGYCAHCQKYYMDSDDYKVLYSAGRPEVQIILDFDDANYQITSGEVFNLERKHLKDVESKISKEVSSIKEAPDYISQYATGGYDDGGLAAAKRDSKERYGKRLEELSEYRPKPYSYRVDISAEETTETYYVGARDIFLDGKQLVISANSSFGHDLVNYQTIKVSRGGKEFGIKLTRQFDIANAQLYGYVNLRTDEDEIFRSGITDPFLVRVLNMRKRQHNLTDIFVTIQENQNHIVDTNFKNNLIVQGCAGSGKTMVLLHRLSSLNYKEKSFDFSRDALVLTPNDQFTVHIRGLAEELQIGRVPKASVEQYYIDLLVLYSQDFRPEGRLTSEMNVRQVFVDYIYSDQFRIDFDKAYRQVIEKRNLLFETVLNLSERMNHPVRDVDFSKNSLVVRQMRDRIDVLNDLIARKDKEIAAAEEEYLSHEERKKYLEDQIKKLAVTETDVIREAVDRVEEKVRNYRSAWQSIITGLTTQIGELTEERDRIENTVFMFGKRARLEKLNADISEATIRYNEESHRYSETNTTYFLHEENLSKDEAIAWMQRVMLIIPGVQDEIRLCTNVSASIERYTTELLTIDSTIENALSRYVEAEESQYPEEIKNIINDLYTELDQYTILGTFQQIFDLAVSAFKEIHRIKNIVGKYHRYDMYARLLFAMRFFDDSRGSTRYICIDEGQDLAVNEYRLIREINQNNVIFNVFGDTNQLIKPGRGIADWNLLHDVFTAKQFELNENYRNTNQITRFCNSSFSMTMLQTGVDGPNVREIPRRELELELSTLDVSNERIAILIPRGVPKNQYLEQGQLPESVQSIIGDRMDNGYIAIMYVDEVKGIEFDKAFVIANQMTRNEKYIAYTRALSELILVIDESLVANEDGASSDVEKTEAQEDEKMGSSIEVLSFSAD